MNPRHHPARPPRLRSRRRSGIRRRRPHAPARRRSGALRAAALASVLLLVLLFAVLLDRTTAPVPPEPRETVSCERYGLEGVSVESREPEDSAGRGIFDLEAFGPGDEPRNRYALGFEHGGVAGKYHVLAEGLDWSEPVGVIYHFHGDGAFEYESPQYSVSCMAEIAQQHNMLLVVPRTPDRTGVPTWWENHNRNAEWFRGLVEERILAEYDVDPSRTWLTGYSGGAQLIAEELLADHVDLVPGGGAIMMGGGEAPERASSEPTRSQLANLRLRWDVGLEDDGSDPKARFDALSAARAGHAWYEDRGYDHASIRYRDGVDHFQLPYAAILDHVLTRAEEDRENGPEEEPRTGDVPADGARTEDVPEDGAPTEDVPEDGTRTGDVSEDGTRTEDGTWTEEET